MARTRWDNVEQFPGRWRGDDEGDQPIVEPFRPFYASQMEGREPKPREWIVDGLIMRKTVTVLSGPPKIGKSLLLQQLLTSCAVGGVLLGRDCVDSRAFGLFCEDDQDELERRQADINVLYDRTPDQFDLDLSWDSRIERDAILVDFKYGSTTPRFTPLWDQLWDHAEERGIEIIGLDTARTIYGGKEIDAGQVTAFMRALQRMAAARNGAVVLNAHPSRADVRSVAGSGAWFASARFGMSLLRPEDWDLDTHGINDGRRDLRGMGGNYGAGLGNERIMIDHGVFLSTEPERTQGPRRGLSQQDRIDLRYRLLMGIKKVLLNGGQIPADTMARESMPNRARRSSDSQINRIPLNDLYTAQDELLDAGQVVRVLVGKKVLLRPTDGPAYTDEKAWEVK